MKVKKKQLLMFFLLLCQLSNVYAQISSKFDSNAIIKPEDYYKLKGTFKIISSDSIINLYADSINLIHINNFTLPDYLHHSCLDADPPVFIGFHTSFRREILKKVYNRVALEYLLSVMPKAEEISNCLPKTKKIYGYGKVSFYGLIMVRYYELSNEQ